MDKGEVKPRCADIRKVLGVLRSKGINLCVVTTDNPEITHECLKKLNIADMFEYVFTDDGITPPKPDSA